MVRTPLSPRRSRILLSAVLAAAIGVAACARAAPEAEVESPPDQGPIHVHGLGMNPADGLLYAATHTGLFRILENGEVERVGESYRDIMGFTVVGPDRFLSSGHPDARERDLPVLLGLMESTDGGETWEALSLLGDADFHVLRHVHGRVYGYDSTGERIMTSRDGHEWRVRSSLRLLDFAVHPERPGRMLATTPDGLVASRDGGRTWEPATGSPPTPLVLLAWEDRAVWGVAADGTVARSDDQGGTWRARGSLGGFPEAFLAVEGGLYAAAHQRGILRSADEGATWDVIVPPPPEGA